MRFYFLESIIKKIRVVKPNRKGQEVNWFLVHFTVSFTYVCSFNLGMADWPESDNESVITVYDTDDDEGDEGFSSDEECPYKPDYLDDLELTSITGSGFGYISTPITTDSYTLLRHWCRKRNCNGVSVLSPTVGDQHSYCCESCLYRNSHFLAS